MGIITPATVLTRVCQALGADEKMVRSKSRVQSLCIVRHIYYYVSFSYYKLTSGSIAKEIGRDHTTTLRSVTTVEGWIKIADPMCMEMLKTVEEKLGISLNDADTVTIPRTEYEQLKNEVNRLNGEVERLTKIEEFYKEGVDSKEVGVVVLY